MSFSIQYTPRTGDVTQQFLAEESRLSIQTVHRTMSITHRPDGDLLVECRDLLGRLVQPTTLLDAGAAQAVKDQRARTHAAIKATHQWGTPKAAAIQARWEPQGDGVLAGIQEVLSIGRTMNLDFADNRKALAQSIWESVQRHLGIQDTPPGTPPVETADLVHSAQNFVHSIDALTMSNTNSLTIPDPPQLVIGDDLVEIGARAMFERLGRSYRGCLWMDPQDKHQTTELTRGEYRDNFRAGLLAVIDHSPEIAPLIKTPPLPAGVDLDTLTDRVLASATLVKDTDADAVKHKVTTILGRHIIAPEGQSAALVDDLAYFVHTYAAGQDTLPQGWDKDLTAQERMLSVGIRGILGRTGGINLGEPKLRRKLAHELFDYCRKYQPATPAETVWPEWQIRESIRRATNLVFIGGEPAGRRDAVDAILKNLKQYVADRNSAPELADADAVNDTIKQETNRILDGLGATKQERKLRKTIEAVVNVHARLTASPKERAKLVNGLFHELNQAPLTRPSYDTFGGFWDAMDALKRDGSKAVLFMAEGKVFAATIGTMPDRVTPTWLVSRGDGNQMPLHIFHNHPGYTILAMAADTEEVPF